MERPVVQVLGLVKQDAIVAGEVVGRPRAPVALEVGGRGADDPAVVGQAAGDQGLVADLAQADGEVQPLADQVDAAVGKRQLQLNVGIAAGEHRHHRDDDAHAETVAQGDPQGAARAKTASADQLLGGVQLVQDLAGALLEKAALGGGRNAPRRPLQQLGAQAVLQAADQLAHGRRRQAQAGCGFGQATIFDDLGEHGHLARAIDSDGLCHGIINDVMRSRIIVRSSLPDLSSRHKEQAMNGYLDQRPVIAFDRHKAEAARLRREAKAEVVDWLVRLFARRVSAQRTERPYGALSGAGWGQ
jgi:hypothetical protein